MELNGCFAVVGEDDGGKWQYAAVDRTASFPLFFNSDLEVFDQLNVVGYSPELDNKMDRDLYAAAGFCLNRNLLVSGHFQLQAGEFLWHSTDSQSFPQGSPQSSPQDRFQITQYQEILPDNRKYFDSQSNSIETLSALSEQVFDRLIEFAQGRRILLGLSGGLDSRYLLAALVERGCKNILAFTYGRKDSFELPLAKQVAEKLEIDWEFVEYSDELLEAYFSPQYEQYQAMAHPYRALPYEQDWFALKQLCDSGKVDPQNTVFVSGFAADICSGSWIPKADRLASISSENEWRKYMATLPKFFGAVGAGEHAGRIQVNEKRRGGWDREGLIFQIQQWGMRHRMSRYQVNGMRAAEFFGMEWYLPFLDGDYLDFWSSVPLEQRIEKTLYREFLHQEYFKPFDIAEEFQSFATYRPHDSIITQAKMKAPQWFKKLVKPMYLKRGVADPNNLYYIRQRIAGMGLFPDREEYNLNQVEALHLLNKPK